MSRVTQELLANNRAREAAEEKPEIKKTEQLAVSEKKPVVKKAGKRTKAKAKKRA